MNFFTILVTMLTIFHLFKDFGKDKGQFKKAKAFHFICILIICVTYSGSFRYLGSTMRNFDKIKANYSVSVGIVPGDIHLLLHFLHLGLVLTVMILAYQMITRKEKARRLILYFLPFLALTETFNFYRGWLSDGDDFQINHRIIFLIGFIFCGGLTTGIIAVYNSKFMREFFNSQPIARMTDGHKVLDSEAIAATDNN